MKFIFAVAAASALLLSSCRKADEVTPSESQFDELEFTATIDGPVTKTTVNTNGGDTNRGKIEWEKGDTITITDKTKEVLVFYVASNSGTTSTFRKASGQSVHLGSGPYTATYGTAPSTTQNYADHYKDATHARNVYMTTGEEPVSGRSLTFTAACGLLKLTLRAVSEEFDKNIRKIDVSGTVDSKAVTYTLICDPAVSIASDTSFYLALPAGSYNEMKFYNTYLTCERHPVSGGMSISSNVIQPVTIGDISFPIEFTVSAGEDRIAGTGDDKKVKFTGGNLWWDGNNWHLESSQTAYPTSWDEKHVGHFYWSKTASVAYAKSYNDGSTSTDDTFFFGEDNGLTVDDQSGLYALTGGDNGEWQYLFKKRANASNLYAKGVSVTTTSAGTVKNCLVIAPDGYTGTIAASYDAAAWAKAEESGLVCLPAAGDRVGSSLSRAGSYGRYWSSAPYESNKIHAYGLPFNGSNVYPADYGLRSYGYSVRLVYTVSK